jgi:cobyrinic acid a,c-diamide synthase
VKTIIIAGTSSGAGKTTVALGLMAAFRRRGLSVAPFKVGPDYIDPLFHKRVCGSASYNLDGWMMGKEAVLNSFSRAAKGHDIAIIEGVMGLFDGYDARSDAGSTAEIAKWLDASVILVVNARSMARSAAALVKGFELFDPGVRLDGVIFNGVGSDRHLKWLKDAVSVHCRTGLFGGFSRESAFSLPERHLGLSTERADRLDERWVLHLAEKIEKEIDLDTLYERAGQVNLPSDGEQVSLKEKDLPVRIGVARDAAFCFYYEENLERLQSIGAELVPFSPMQDPHLPEGIDGLYLGGGYPEVHAEILSANKTLPASIREASRGGLPIYAECGGMIYLSKGLYDREGSFHPLVGVFPFETEMLERRQALGYVTVTVTEDNLLGSAGSMLRGHEFHYSRILGEIKGMRRTTRIQKRSGEEVRPEGFQVEKTFGSYVHLHFAAFVEVAENLVREMRVRKRMEKV